MKQLSSSQLLTVIVVIIILLFPPGTTAFGAGGIPGFAYLNGIYALEYCRVDSQVLTVSCIGKAFRHGDIEDGITQLVKSAGHFAVGGAGLFAAAHSLLAKSGSKFSKEDVKRIYFVCMIYYRPHEEGSLILSELTMRERC